MVQKYICTIIRTISLLQSIAYSLDDILMLVYHVPQGTLPFMSMHLLDAWDRNAQALHTAVDDLESFFWVLIWSLVKILKKVASITNENSTILRLEKALSSHSFDSILRRESIAYKELAFMDFIDDWQKIKQDAYYNIKNLERRLHLSNKDSEIQDIFNELDKHCLVAYEKFIQEGYKHLQIIQMKFPSWEDVIDHNDHDSLYM